MSVIDAKPGLAAAVHRVEAKVAPRRVRSAVMYWACGGAAVGVVTLLVLVAGYLLMLGLPGIRWSLFLRDPTGDVANPGGLRHAIVGTGILIALASCVGVPMGVLTGVYLSEYSQERGFWGRWLAGPVRFVADVLAGVPSIVIGIIGYELLVVPFASGEFLGVSVPVLRRLGINGYNGWAGSLALAFIMIPIVARTTEEMLKLVPRSYREGSLALGATKSQTILRVVVPAASGSVVTGVMLAVARVAGETAPLLFTALGSRMLTTNPSQPFPSLTVQVYNYVTGPYQEQKQVGWSGILVLIGLLLVLNMGVRVITARTIRRRGAKA